MDSRVYSLDKSNSSNFDYWLKVTPLNGKRITIPLRGNKHFYSSQGQLGKTIELNFQELNYTIIQHAHNSLTKNRKVKGLEKVKRIVKFTFNKQQPLEDLANKILNRINPTDLSTLTKTIGFDLGLSTLLATSEGQLLGTYWLDKLKEGFAKSIPTLIAHGTVSRRELLELLRSNHYFKKDLTAIAKTTEESGLTPISLDKCTSAIAHALSKELKKNRCTMLTAFPHFFPISQNLRREK